ncbi:MAG TPA: LysR family transcriptional regulator [Pirellulaceae bacterium]|jgi:DNA-binding transcriptional LysR family regulator|nr:LysR family transcriptional regulator [Pirellulaceae bacterium]
MADPYVSLDTDQIAAFVELARRGSLRAAAESLSISEQGLRSRLISLETRLKVELYRKARGPRRASPLTPQGRIFLPRAVEFLQKAEELAATFQKPSGPRTIDVAATQYLILYALLDVIRRFHASQPDVRVRLTNRVEQEIETELLGNSDVEIGVAAPYEHSATLEYLHLFATPWGLVAPKGHRLLKKKSLDLADIADEPLILFERGSSGRQHVMEAFREAGLSPRVETETTNTEIVVRMVEAGLGVSIVPLLANGKVTRGRSVGTRLLGDRIRPIRSGVLIRRDVPLTPAARTFVDFLQSRFR